MNAFLIAISAAFLSVASAAVVHLPSKSIEFNLNRDTDMREIALNVFCSRECTLLEKPQCLTTMNTHACDNFSVNGVKITGYFANVPLVKTGKSSYKFTGAHIEYKEKNKATICLRVPTNINASDLVNENDSQSIASYCSTDLSYWETKPDSMYYVIYNNHRSPSLEDFLRVLESPLEVILK